MNMRGMYGFMCNKPYPYGEPLSEEDIGKYLGQNDLTEFAEKYGIGSFDDFMVFCDTIKANLTAGDFETGIAQIKDAVFMAGLKYLFSFDNPLSEDAVRGMLDVMGRAFDDLADCVANSEDIKATHKKMGGTEEKTSENSQNSDNLTKIIQKDEKNNNKDLTEVKDMEVVEKVIKMIGEKFETTEPVTAENLDVVVGKIP